MLTRVFDDRVSVTAGMLGFEREVFTEDGIVLRFYEAPVVEARTARGGVFAAMLDFPSEKAAEEFVSDLPSNFRPEADPQFVFVRNSYGSSAYSVEDEVALMDDPERDRFLQGA